MNLRLPALFLLVVTMLTTSGLTAATITVMNTNNNGPGSFRQAVLDAVSGDEIVFDASTDGITISLTGAEIVVRNTITVIGNGKTATVISAAHNARAFGIRGGDLTLRNLTVRDGRSARGGAVRTLLAGILRAENVVFVNNKAVGAASNMGGGAVANVFGRIFILPGCEFTNNRATGASGSGGAILHLLGSLSVNGASFTNNTCPRAGGAIEDQSGNSSVAVITNCDFSGNTTGPSPGNGGAIHITGNGSMNITGGSATNNVAAREGGAFWNGTGNMRVSGVNISGNAANGPAADDGGGGIFNNGGALFVNNFTQITGNTANGASGSGGGIFNATNGLLAINFTVISDNVASRAGGGLEDASGSLDSAEVVINSSRISGNSTGSAPGNGGGVHISGDGDMIIVGCNVTGNSAASEGGGLWNNKGTMILDKVRLSNNVASGTDPNNGGGGAFNNGGNLDIRNSTIWSNSSIASVGGGIFNDPSGLLLVTNSTVSTNDAATNGGGIFNGGKANITNATITQNDAINLGGGIFSSGTDTTRLASTILAGNTATLGVDLRGSSYFSENYNFIGDIGNSFFPKSDDIFGTVAVLADPMLAALAVSGSSQPTHALLCGSEAIDAGTPGDNSPDQRNKAIFGGRRDIGAFELQVVCDDDDMGITEAPVENSLRPTLATASIYPNPSRGGLTQLFIPTIFEGTIDVMIYDLGGKLISRQQLTAGTHQLQLIDQPAGTYVLRLVADGQTKTLRLMID